MLLALLSCAGKAGAQTVAVKSDLLTGSMLTSPNLGVELKLSERFTLEAGFHYNPFPAGGDRRWKHWFVQPELRYWMCQLRRTFLRGKPDVRRVQRSKARLPFGLFKGIRSERYEGDFTGVGISYGYHFILSPRWGLETSIGVGFLHTGYERYRCSHCGERTGSGNRNLVAPTKAAISIVYMIK